ncbi:hypothetical protein KEM56_001659 [Ascosphaera pollenicola]|nr:hypothetical protein KEM56_001659 [Ascosphaera pollenicola]
MRVNWGPEANQLLLLKLLETHTIRIDADKIAAAWQHAAKENGEGPSVRSIKDQLTRLRNAAWNQGDIAASSPRTPRTPRHRHTGTSVPQTPRSNRTRTSATLFSSFAKRARDEVEADEEWQPATPTPKRRESPRKVDRNEEVDSENGTEAKTDEGVVVIDDE